MKFSTLTTCRYWSVYIFRIVSYPRVLIDNSFDSERHFDRKAEIILKIQRIFMIFYNLFIFFF